MLDIRQLTQRRGSRTVLDAVSFAMPAGSLTVLAGPAGGGKTALMRLLGGFDQPQSGEMLLDGQPLGRNAPRQAFGIVQQPDVLLPHLTIAENIAAPLRAVGMRRPERLALACESFDLTQPDAAPDTRLRDAGPADWQRTLLARAAVTGPKVLLLDEPFRATDEMQHLAMTAALLRIHQLLGATTLLATRNVRGALSICDQVVVLREGVLAQAAAPEEMFNRPTSDFVASLCGETNRLAGTLCGREDDIAEIQLACGPLVEARLTGDLPEGSTCVFVLRPEHIAVAPVPAAEMGDGALDATLIEARFWGESYRLRLLIGSGAELVVRRPAIAGMRGLAPGRSCAVAWQSHHAMIFSSPHS